MFPDRAHHVTDPASGLAGRLTVLTANDGGASAVAVGLRNPAADRDVVLKVNTAMSAFIMLTVTDEEGTVLSKRARTFSTSEVQHFETVRLAPGSAHRWVAPVAGQLDASALPPQGLNGRLVVNVALRFSIATHREQPADAELESSVMTLYDMGVRFTRAALSAAPVP